MAVNLSGVNLQSATYAAKLNDLANKAAADKTSDDASTSTAATASDKVSLSGNSDVDGLTYTDPRKAAADAPANSAANSSAASTTDGSNASGVDLASMLDNSNQQVQQFTEMLSNILKQQGLSWNKVVSGEQHLSADPKTIAAAKQAVSDDGDFGIKKTAERILTFAKAAIQANPDQADTIKAAVQSGFDQAAQYFGGKLPDISNKTHDAIMNTLDSWSKNGIPDGDVQVVMPDDDQSSDASAANASGGTTTTTISTTATFSQSISIKA